MGRRCLEIDRQINHGACKIVLCRVPQTPIESRERKYAELNREDQKRKCKNESCEGDTRNKQIKAGDRKENNLKTSEIPVNAPEWATNTSSIIINEVYSGYNPAGQRFAYNESPILIHDTDDTIEREKETFESNTAPTFIDVNNHASHQISRRSTDNESPILVNDTEDSTYLVKETFQTNAVSVNIQDTNDTFYQENAMLGTNSVSKHLDDTNNVSKQREEMLGMNPVSIIIDDDNDTSNEEMQKRKSRVCDLSQMRNLIPLNATDTDTDTSSSSAMESTVEEEANPFEKEKYHAPHLRADCKRSTSVLVKAPAYAISDNVSLFVSHNSNKTVLQSIQLSDLYNMKLPAKSWNVHKLDEKHAVICELITLDHGNKRPNMWKDVCFDLERLECTTSIFNMKLGEVKRVTTIVDLERCVEALDALILCKGGPSRKQYAITQLQRAYLDSFDVWRHKNCGFISDTKYSVCSVCIKLDDTLRKKVTKVWKTMSHGKDKTGHKESQLQMQKIYNRRDVSC